jgi:hypothetical protein
VPETCRKLKNRINKSIKSGASSWFSARKNSIWKLVFYTPYKKKGFLVLQNFLLLQDRWGAGLLSLYSDSLLAGRCGELILVGARFSGTVQTGTEAHPAFSRMGTGSSPGIKWQRRGFDHHPI